MEKLVDILDGFDAAGVVLAGDFMLDEYVYGDVERISPEAPVPVLRVTRRESRPGGAGNVASIVRSLGGSVRCVGLIGQDAPGGELISQLQNCGADTAGLVELPGRPTVRKTRYVGLAQHKNPHQILRVDDEDAAPLPADVRDALLNALSEGLAGGACLTLQDHNKGLFSAGLAGDMIGQARQQGCKVIVDPALIEDFSRYRGATLLAPNRYEAQLATGVKISDEGSLAQAAGKIAETTDAEFVVITLDRQGSFLYRSEVGKGEIIPAEPHEVADGTGAGDAVTATLSVSISAGCNPGQAVELGNIAGGLEVEHFGVAAITREQIARELRGPGGARRSKIMTREQLAREVASLRQASGTVVFTNGCFDLLHMGHVQYLIQARQCGTRLIVAINSDKSVAKVKGPTRPIVSQDERAAMLAALECVDYVTIFDEETPEALLELLRPGVLVKGGSTDIIVGQEFVESYGGRVQRLDLVQGRSTTETINKIMETHDTDSGGL